MGTGFIDEHGLQLDYGYLYLKPQLSAWNVLAGTPDTIVQVGVASIAPFTELSVAAADLIGQGLDTSDVIRWEFPINEMKMDHGYDIHARVVFETGGNITPTGADFRLAAKGVAIGQAYTDAKTTPDASLDFFDFVTTAGAVLAATEFKAFNALGLFANDETMMVALTVQSRGSATADQMRLRYVQLRYTYRLMATRGVRELT